MSSKTNGLELPADLREELERRAAGEGRVVDDLALELLTTAWSARKELDRGVVDAASELDRLVRIALLLGDCEPAFVADATGVPPSLVERILDGWRQAATNPPEAASIPPSKPASNFKLKRWSEAERAELTRLWGEGMEVPQIAERLGRPASAVQQYAGTHRDLCPKRRSR